QAEDGIRGRNVTGVQTCALPIFPFRPREFIRCAFDPLSRRFQLPQGRTDESRMRPPGRMERIVDTKVNLRENGITVVGTEPAAKIGRATGRERVGISAAAAAGRR